VIDHGTLDRAARRHTRQMNDPALGAGCAVIVAPREQGAAVGSRRQIENQHVPIARRDGLRRAEGGRVLVECHDLDPAVAELEHRLRGIPRRRWPGLFSRPGARSGAGLRACGHPRQPIPGSSRHHLRHLLVERPHAERPRLGDGAQIVERKTRQPQELPLSARIDFVPNQQSPFRGDRQIER
jgi:hypothetical protein